MALPKVAIIVLNYKRPQDTIRCVLSVLQDPYPEKEILIVDNDSQDGSAELFRKEFPQIQTIANPINTGYAGGNNRGIRELLPKPVDYIVILNNDVFLTGETLGPLVQIGESFPKSTLIAPKINYEGDHSIINSAGTSIDWFRMRPFESLCGQKDQPEVIHGTKTALIIPGSFYLIKRRLFDEVGLFNEDFFLIHEDADLCFRNIKRGYENRICLDIRAYHKVSATLSAYPFLSRYYTTRNFLYLVEIHGSLWNKLQTAVGCVLFCVKYLLLLSKDKENARGFFTGLRDYFLRKRGRYQ